MAETGKRQAAGGRNGGGVFFFSSVFVSFGCVLVVCWGVAEKLGNKGDGMTVERLSSGLDES